MTGMHCPEQCSQKKLPITEEHRIAVVLDYEECRGIYAVHLCWLTSSRELSISRNEDARECSDAEKLMFLEIPYFSAMTNWNTLAVDGEEQITSRIISTSIRSKTFEGVQPCLHNEKTFLIHELSVTRSRHLDLCTCLHMTQKG